LQQVNHIFDLYKEHLGTYLHQIIILKVYWYNID